MNQDGSQLRDLGPGIDPRWSSTGKLGFIASGTLEYRSGGALEGGLVVVQSDFTARRLGFTARSFAWSPDGREIAYSTGPELRRSDAAPGSPSHLVYRLPRPWVQGCGGGEAGLGPGTIFNVEWSPDGRWIGFGDDFLGCYVSQLRLIAADGIARRVLIGQDTAYVTIGGNLEATDMAWSADSRKLVFVGEHIYLARGDGTHAAALPPPISTVTILPGRLTPPKSSSAIPETGRSISHPSMEAGVRRIGPATVNSTPSWTP